MIVIEETSNGRHAVVSLKDNDNALTSVSIAMSGLPTSGIKLESVCDPWKEDVNHVELSILAER